MRNFSNMIKKAIFLFIGFFIFLTSCGVIQNLTGKKDKESKRSTLTERKEFYISSLLIDAKKEMLIGNFEKSADLYQQCLQLDKNNAVAMFELAKMYLLSNKANEALILAKNAAKIEPDNVWYLELYSETLLKNGKFAEAAKIYESVVEKRKHNPESYIHLANIYINARDFTKALQIYAQMEEKYGIAEDIILQKQRIYLYLKKTDLAIVELQKLKNKYPNETKYQQAIGDLFLEKGDTAAALKIFQEILVKDTSNAHVHFSMAQYYQSKGDKENSFSELKLAFSSANLDIDVKIGILMQYYYIVFQTHDSLMKKQAYKLLQILTEVHPTEGKSWSVYADFLYKDRRLDEAKNAFIKVLEIDDTKYPVWEQYLFVLYELADYAALDSASQKAVELFPNQSFLYLMNANANYGLRIYEKVIVSSKRGLDFSGRNNAIKVQLFSLMGDTYNHLKNYENSDQAYEEVLKIEPENVFVLNNYSYYLSLRGEKLDKAEKMSLKTVQKNPNNATYLDTYAWILFKQQKFQEALKVITKAFLNGGDQNAIIIEHFGDILYKTGDREKAWEMWKKAKVTGSGSDMLERKAKDGNLYE